MKPGTLDLKVVHFPTKCEGHQSFTRSRGNRENEKNKKSKKKQTNTKKQNKREVTICRRVIDRSSPESIESAPGTAVVRRK